MFEYAIEVLNNEISEFKYDLRFENSYSKIEINRIKEKIKELKQVIKILKESESI